MASGKDYFVATTAQLLGKNEIGTTKPKSKPSRSGTHDVALKAREELQDGVHSGTSKTVRFATNVKSSDIHGDTDQCHLSVPGLSAEGERAHRRPRKPRAHPLSEPTQASVTGDSSLTKLKTNPDTVHAAFDNPKNGDVISSSGAYLDAKHQTLASKPSIAIDTAWLGHNEQLSTDTGHLDTGLGSREIYFQPLDADSNFTRLSSPRNPPLANAKEEEFKQETVPGIEPVTSSGSVSIHGTDELPTLTPGELDRLVCALLMSPLIRSHVTRVQWSDVPRPFAPSANTGEHSNESPGLASTLFSQPNSQFVTTSQAKRYTESESPTITRSPAVPHPPSSEPTKIAIVDPQIHGAPIRCFSRPFRPATVGLCTFLNMPYGSNVETSLRIDRPSPEAKHTPPSKVTLQTITRIVDRRTGQRRSMLVAEADLTPAFHAAAIAQLSAMIGRCTEDISVSSPVFSSSLSASSSFSTSTDRRSNPRQRGQQQRHIHDHDHDHDHDHAHLQASNPTQPPEHPEFAAEDMQQHEAEDAEIDWIALADSLQRSAELADAVDVAAEWLAGLEAPLGQRQGSASQRQDGGEGWGAAGVAEAVAALLDGIDAARAARSRFWVLRPGREEHASGVPMRVGVPWVSGVLYADALEDGAGQVVEEGEEGEEVHVALVARVAKLGRERREFSEWVAGRLVRFVPVSGGWGSGRDGDAWVCFAEARG